MLMILPQYVVSFAPLPPHDGSDVHWLVNGDDKLDALCQVLRCDQIHAYSVDVYEPERDNQRLGLTA